MRPKVLISRKIFDGNITMAKKYFEVENNQDDIPLGPHELIQRLQGKARPMILLTDRINEDVLS